MKKSLSFDDVLLQPQFSSIKSRRDVSVSSTFLGLTLDNPIISSNMDTITEEEMASTMIREGAIGCLHRFCTINRNVEMFYNVIDKIANSNSKHYKLPIVSIGVGDNEYKRAMALFDSGATHFLIDVAHGASTHVVEMYDRLRNRLSDKCYIIVGNFATAESVKEFNKHVKSKRLPDAYKVGIGGGSLCTTRVVTGSGCPTLGSIIDIASLGVTIIADGGMKNSGDISKALAAGASVCMLGGVLAGTEETPGEVIYSDWRNIDIQKTPTLPDERNSFEPRTGILVLQKAFVSHKKYRGSASQESYDVQDKTSGYISPEGESTLVPFKGSVVPILKQIEGGLRSALSYSGAKDLTSFRKNARLIEVSQAGFLESQAHGKV